jgi:hypothetical protein
MLHQQTVEAVLIDNNAGRVAALDDLLLNDAR